MNTKCIEYLDYYMYHDEMNRINNDFIHEAIKEWDMHGGIDYRCSYEDFVKDYLRCKWRDLIISN